MPATYLHHHPAFSDLLRILEAEKGILAGLIEKDYWIMHVLHGLQQQGYDFELKGGTSLSKGYQVIHRFSEDIDIHIKPDPKFGVNQNPKNTKATTAVARKNFYDALAGEIRIDGIIATLRDTSFDDTEYYRSGGIRLLYESKTTAVTGLKEGVLLEAGFDTVTPNNKLMISSWAYERAVSTPSINIIDNRAVDIACYHPGYTLVEKLQTIATKFRQEQADGIPRPNYMRQYYDIYCLLNNEEVQQFIGTEAYLAHKAARFPKPDLAIPIAQNEAFLLNNTATRTVLCRRYKASAALYYNGQPEFESILERIESYSQRL